VQTRDDVVVRSVEPRSATSSPTSIRPGSGTSERMPPRQSPRARATPATSTNSSTHAVERIGSDPASTTKPSV